MVGVEWTGMDEIGTLRANQMTGSIAERNIFGEVESLTPIDDLAVSVVGIFGAERWPADQTFEHDGPDRPPVTAECVPFTGENLRCNVIGSSDCGICHLST